MKRFESPVLCLLGKVTVLLYEHIQKAAAKHLNGYPALKTKAIQLIYSEMDNNKARTEEALKFFISSQMTFVNTNHPDFQWFSKVMKGKADGYVTMRHINVNKQWTILYLF